MFYYFGKIIHKMASEVYILRLKSRKNMGLTQSSWRCFVKSHYEIWKIIKREKRTTLFLFWKQCLADHPLPENLTTADRCYKPEHRKAFCPCSPTDMYSPVVESVNTSMKGMFCNSRYSRIPPITAKYDLLNTLVLQVATYFCSQFAEVSMLAGINLSIWGENRLQLISQI